VTLDLRQLAAYMEWADATAWRAVLEAPAARADASLLDTMHHVHLVQHLFHQAWAGEPLQVSERTPSQPPGALARWGRDAHRDIAAFLSTAREADLSFPFRMPWASRFEERAGRPAAAHTLEESVLQVVLHTQHHRGQLCARLRALGLEPPALDFIVWMWGGRPAPDWPAQDEH